MTRITVPTVASPAFRLLPLWAVAAMAVTGGALLSSALSLHPHWWAAWAAPVVLYAAALAGPPGRGRWIGALAGGVAGIGMLPYLIAQIGWPPALLILLLRALAWSLTVDLAERSARTLPAWLAVLTPALSAAGLDTLVLTLSPHGANGSLANSQMNVPSVIQVAALGGAPAIVFLVLLGGGLGGLLAGRLMGAPLPGRRLAWAAGLVVAVQGAALGFGAARLWTSDAGPRAPVALIATDEFPSEPRDWARVWRAYGPAVRAAARPGTIVLLPEKIALLSSEQAQAAAREVSALARARAATLVVGLEVRQGGGFFNRALIAQPDGAIAWYDKRRPVPGLEARITPGRSRLVIGAGGARAGLAICKDMHFAAIGREYGRAAVALVLVPAWDFDRDGWIADRMTALRGVESGYAVVRSSRNGVSSVRDRFGRVLAEAPSDRATRTLKATVTLAARPQPTLYARIGNLFGWSCLVAAILLAALVRLRMRSDSRPQLIDRAAS